MRGIDLHVHVPTAEWLCGCMGPYVDSVERYFGRRPEPVGVEELIATYERLDLGGVLLGWDAERATGRPPLDSAWLARVCVQSGGRFVGFGSVDPLRPDALERVARFPAWACAASSSTRRSRISTRPPTRSCRSSTPLPTSA